MGLVKFMDLVKFKEIFDSFYKPPLRIPKLGHYNMVYGLIMLLFIGFNRVWHFIYIQLDSMLCSIFNVLKLPYVTTYWRYVNSLGINQGKSLLMVMSAMRERVWQLCEIGYPSPFFSEEGIGLPRFLRNPLNSMPWTMTPVEFPPSRL